MNATIRATVTDPVCGMTIDPEHAAGASSYDGETYHFCSHRCETKFTISPERYATATASSDQSTSCCATKEPANPGRQSCC